MNSWEIVDGDCIDVLATIPPGSVRLLFADTKYNIGINYGDGAKADRLPANEYLDWCRTWMTLGARTLTDDGSMWTLIDPRWAGRFQCVLEDIGLCYRETIIWHETFGVYCEGKFGRDHRPLFRFTKHPKRQVFHPDRVPSARETIYGDKRADARGRVPSNVWTISRVCGTFNERIAEFPTQLPLELLRRVVAPPATPATSSWIRSAAAPRRAWSRSRRGAATSVSSRARSTRVFPGRGWRRRWCRGIGRAKVLMG